MNGAKKMMI